MTPADASFRKPVCFLAGRKPSLRIQWFFTVLFGLLLLAGCQTLASRKSTIESLARNSTQRLERDMRVKPFPAAGGAPERMNFEDLCFRAALHHELLAGRIFEIRQLGLDLGHASTLAFPRLELRGGYEYPLAGNRSGDGNFTGGLYAHLDLMRALFFRDEALIRQIKYQNAIYRAQMVVKDIIREAYMQLIELDALGEIERLRDRQLDEARANLELARALQQAPGADPQDVWYWQAMVMDCAGKRIEIKSKAGARSRALKRNLAIELDQPFLVTDLDQVRGLFPGRLHEGLLPADVWHKRTEARLSEAELVEADFAVALAERENWPKITASLGIGEIPLNGREENSTVVPQVGISLPLWDFGDNALKVSKAKILFESKKRTLEDTALRLWNEARESDARLRDALEALQLSTERNSEIDRQQQTSWHLVKHGRLSAQKALEINHLAFDAKAAHTEASLKAAQAAAHYHLSAGGPIIAGMEDKILSRLMASRTESMSPVASE